MAKGNIKSTTKHKGRTTRLAKTGNSTSQKKSQGGREPAAVLQAPKPVMIHGATNEGLKALTEMLGKVETAPKATIVVTHHLDSEHQGRLATLLASDPHVQMAESMHKMQSEFAGIEGELRSRVAEVGTLTDELESIMESIHLPLIIVGKDLHVRRCSPSAEQVLHIGMLDLGRKITSLKLSIQIPDLAEMISKVMATLKVGQREVTDKSGHWFSLVIRPYNAHHGEIQGAVLTFIDIDDQKRNTAVFEARRVLGQRFLDVAQGVLLVLDAQLNVTMIGKSGCELLGWAEKEIVGKNWVDQFVPKNHGIAVRTIFDRIIGGVLDDSYEYPVFARDGEERIILWRSGVVHDEAGNVTSIVSSGEDLTMLRQINGALQKSEDRFHVMMESVREDEFFIMDDEGYIVSWIARREERKSFRAEEMIGQHFSCLYSPDDFQSGKPMRILDIAGNQGRFEEEGWRMRKDGTRMKAYVIVMAIRDEHRNLLGFSNVTRYVRDRVDAREIPSIQAPSRFVTTP